MGPFTGVEKTLGRLYVEAMMPAVLGQSDVVMDRSWLSEKPYGQAFRGGVDRLGIETVRLLERLALRCQTTVVLGLPPLETITETFCRRSGQEMLDNPAQLAQVYHHYDKEMKTALPVHRWNYTIDSPLFWTRLNYLETASAPHPLNMATAGNWNAKILLVGESFAKRGEFDSLYQWPFGALGGGGCSRWLARKLDELDISERDLLWVNADAGDAVLKEVALGKIVIALGGVARDKLEDLHVPHEHFSHPQSWRRFHTHEPYPLITRLKELTV